MFIGDKMKIYSISIENFRGIRSANLVLPHHAVLIGDNNTGKSTVLEALDLVLGPDRLNRRPTVDEHDFDTRASIKEPEIKIEVTITKLSKEQKAHFCDYIEWLDTDSGKFYEDANPMGVDKKTSLQHFA